MADDAQLCPLLRPRCSTSEPFAWLLYDHAPKHPPRARQYSIRGRHPRHSLTGLIAGYRSQPRQTGAPLKRITYSLPVLLYARCFLLVKANFSFTAAKLRRLLVAARLWEQSGFGIRCDELTSMSGGLTRFGWSGERAPGGDSRR